MNRSVRRGIKETSYIRQLQPSLDRDDQYSIDVVDPFLRRNLVNLIRNNINNDDVIGGRWKKCEKEKGVKDVG